MSLLLDALKKAEKAKEDAQRRAKGGGDQSAEAAPDAEAGKHVLTRPELPDISQPLEILSEDLQAKGAAPELALAPEAPPPAAEPKPAAARREPQVAAEPPAAERAAARKVFEAKYKEPNPRMPFYITMGVLGAFAFGTVGYFWYQLRPAQPLVNANPPRPSGEKPVDVAALKPVGGAPAPQAQAAPASSAIPGLPAAPSAATPPARTEPTPTPTPAEKPAAALPVAPVAQAAAPLSRAKPAPAAKRPAETVTVSAGAVQIHPRVQAGYGAYQSGDLAAARAEYQGALRDDPVNRDALLGLAAVEMRAQRYEQSEAYYLRLLELDPRDPNAQAGLLALRGQTVDPVAAESRLKTLLAANPEAQMLHFALGNQYAQQGRWAEAQAAYFKAFAADPENPDVAFNLAVSLDQLRQPKLALEHYRRALALAEKRAASFAPQTARERAQQLAR